MLRFYFDLHDGPNISPDEFGDDFVDFEEAREHAQAILADMAREEMPDGEERHFRCDIRDGSGAVVYRARLTFHGEMGGMRAAAE